MVSRCESEDTRQTIIDAAYDLFVEQGFHATSMRQIAQKSGVSLGTIYNHFEHKEQIFDSLLLEKHPYHQVLTSLQAATGEMVEDFIRNAAFIISAEIERRPDFLQLLFVELNEFQSRHVPMLMRTIYPQFLPLLQRIEQGQKQLRNMPPQVMVLSFAWIFLAHLGEAALDPNGSLFSQSGNLENYLEIFLHGVLVSPKPELKPE